jgi:ABC-type sugar transport system substrate-binding protein
MLLSRACRPTRTPRFSRLAAVVAACLVVACGSDDEESTAESAEITASSASNSASPSATASSSEPTTVSSARSTGSGGGDLVEAPPTQPPTEIGVTIPLTATPEPGVRVAWLACELPSCSFFTSGFEAATAALGWDLQVINFPSATPGQAVQEAVQEGVDFMAITGSPRALYEEQLQAADAAGIPVISCNATDPPDPDAGLVTQCGDATMFRQQALNLARWMINDSAGDAHVAVVSLRDYPILVEAEDQMTETLREECSGCSLDVIPITVDNLASGGVPQLIVSHLQSNLDTNYVAFTFSDPLLGVEPLLEQAGMTNRVKLAGLALSDVSIAALVDGTAQAWAAQPISYQSWLMVDAMARLSVGMGLEEERQAANLPTWIVDTPEVAESLVDAGYWPGPADYESQFKELWGVD